MKTYKDIALNSKYFVKVNNILDMNGCTVVLPENIFNNINSISYTYLINGDGVELYNNSFELISFINSPEFATRAIIIYDIFTKANKIGIKPELIFCFKNNELLGDYTKFKKLMCDVPNIDLESKLIKALVKINDDTYLVDKEISEIFNTVKSKIITNGEILC